MATTQDTGGNTATNPSVTPGQPATTSARTAAGGDAGGGVSRGCPGHWPGSGRLGDDLPSHPGDGVPDRHAGAGVPGRHPVGGSRGRHPSDGALRPGDGRIRRKRHQLPRTDPLQRQRRRGRQADERHGRRREPGKGLRPDRSEPDVARAANAHHRDDLGQRAGRLSEGRRGPELRSRRPWHQEAPCRAGRRPGRVAGRSDPRAPAHHLRRPGGFARRSASRGRGRRL